MLDSWFTRTATSVEVPQPGSELFADDLAFRYSPISEISRISLASGVEHLRMVRVVIDARQLFPSATFTALRGALVGGAQAVWILSPDNTMDRQSRGLTVIAEEYAQLAKCYREADRLQPGTVPTDQWAWINERMDQLAQIRGPRPPELNQTTMIATALDEAFPNNLDRQQSGRLLWRQMSSDAHVLTWGMAQRSRVGLPAAKGEDLSVLTAPGTLDHTADAFLCTFELARKGWSLFDRRCEAPKSSQPAADDVSDASATTACASHLPCGGRRHRTKFSSRATPGKATEQHRRRRLRAQRHRGEGRTSEHVRSGLVLGHSLVHDVRRDEPVCRS